MPVIYTRSKYDAPRVPYERMTRQPSPREAFIHHSADREGLSYNTKDEQVRKVKEYDSYHRSKGWSMGGYHWVVFQRTGTRNISRAYQLRPALYVPAAQLNHNTRTLAICVVGNGEVETLFEDTLACIRQVIRMYANITHVGGHRDVVSTSCPGRNFYAQLDHIAKPLGLKRV